MATQVDGSQSDGRWPAVLAAAIASGVAIALFIRLVRIMGFRIPQPHIEADYLIGVIWAAILGLGILFWPVPVRDRPRILLLWAAKVFVTLGFMLAYEWNYGLDSYNYFSASLSPRFPLESSGWKNGTDNLAGLAWIHSALLPDSFHAMKVSFAMVGLIAIYIFYRAGVLLLRRDEPWMLYALGLFPSVLFWSSTLGKDPVQFLGMALYAYGVIGWQRTGNRSNGITIGLGILIAAYIRIWMAPLLIAPLLIAGFFRARGAVRWAIAGVAAIGVWLIANWLARVMFISNIANLYLAAQVVTRGWEGGSSPDSMVVFSGFGDMLAYIPYGAFTALFRPFPGEVMNPFGLLAGLEDLLLIVLLIGALRRFRSWPLRDPIVIWGIAVVVCWSAFYAFLSPNNFGAGVRFKLQILPFLLALLWALAHSRRRSDEDPARGSAT